ncbi:MAG: hypothetical protein ACTS5A_03590 [Candidatus Hodgkinia cicadicola]
MYVRSGTNATTKHRRTGGQTYPIYSGPWGLVDLPAEHLQPTEHFRRSLNLSPLTFRRSLTIASERLGGGQVSFEVAPSAVMAQL